MKKIFLVSLSLILLSSVVAKAEGPCGKNSINYVDRNIELVNVIDKPEKNASGNGIPGRAKVMVAGIYMFVRNGQTWNVYLCADNVKLDEVKFPVRNLANCILKNDFKSGTIVKKFGSSGIKVEYDRSGPLFIRLNAAEADDYYQVKDTTEGLEVKRFDYVYNKQTPSASRVKPTSLGVCRYDGRNESTNVSSSSSSQGGHALPKTNPKVKKAH